MIKMKKDGTSVCSDGMTFRGELDAQNYEVQLTLSKQGLDKKAFFCGANNMCLALEKLGIQLPDPICRGVTSQAYAASEALIESISAKALRQTSFSQEQKFKKKRGEGKQRKNFSQRAGI